MFGLVGLGTCDIFGNKQNILCMWDLSLKAFTYPYIYNISERAVELKDRFKEQSSTEEVDRKRNGKDEL